MSSGIFSHHTIYPFKFFGLTSSFWAVHIDILIATWVAMAILIILIIIGRAYTYKNHNFIFMSYKKTIEFFMGLYSDSLATFNYHHFSFIVTIFVFTFLCCIVGLIPFIEEATKDINTSLAIALVSFIYIQYQKITTHGIKGYLQEFIEPFFILAPIHIVGELSKIASMSFRLFGNILGGSVILTMIIDLLKIHKKWFVVIALTIMIMHLIINKTHINNNIVGKKIINNLLNVLFIVAWIQILLGIFEGLIQSFVLTMLTTTYLAMGIQHNTPHQEIIDTKDASL